MLRGIATVGLLSGASAFSIAGVPAQPTLARVFMNEPMPVEQVVEPVEPVEPVMEEVPPSVAPAEMAMTSPSEQAASYAYLDFPEFRYGTGRVVPVQLGGTGAWVQQGPIKTVKPGPRQENQTPEHEFRHGCGSAWRDFRL